ncbi:hypothetical protein [Luteolibacter sp.]|uniref:hypothetical protein n=1 Tax=Luteolibacter sp. TaxID=1962973 RepID=UPI0032642AB7
MTPAIQTPATISHTVGDTAGGFPVRGFSFVRIGRLSVAETGRVEVDNVGSEISSLDSGTGIRASLTSASVEDCGKCNTRCQDNELAGRTGISSRAATSSHTA